MKEEYEALEMETIQLGKTDVIITSGCNQGGSSELPEVFD